jgi:hypothetical protein
MVSLMKKVRLQQTTFSQWLYNKRLIRFYLQIEKENIFALTPKVPQTFNPISIDVLNFPVNRTTLDCSANFLP